MNLSETSRLSAEEKKQTLGGYDPVQVHPWEPPIPSNPCSSMQCPAGYVCALFGCSYGMGAKCVPAPPGYFNPQLPGGGATIVGPVLKP